MKKSKSKPETKALKKDPKKDSKKDSKKTARKELGSNLSAKFKEVIESLGHEAEVIAKDLEKVSKFLSKKLSDKNVKSSKAQASLIKTLDSAIEEVKSKQAEDVQSEPAVAEKPVKKTRTRRSPVSSASKEAGSPAQQNGTEIPKRGRRPSAKTETVEKKESAAKPATTRRRGPKPKASPQNEALTNESSEEETKSE